MAPIEVLAALHPGLRQVACFDEAFHAKNLGISRMYGLPDALKKEGDRRFGFHGLSYEYIAGELPKFEPRAVSGRVIVAHLGSGASMCALAFDERAVVKSFLERSGSDALPLILVDGEVGLAGRYPTRAELTRWASIATLPSAVVAKTGNAG